MPLIADMSIAGCANPSAVVHKHEAIVTAGDRSNKQSRHS